MFPVYATQVAVTSTRARQKVREAAQWKHLEEREAEERRKATLVQYTNTQENINSEKKIDYPSVSEDLRTRDDEGRGHIPASASTFYATWKVSKYLETFQNRLTPASASTFSAINHRYESAKAEGITLVPCLIKYGLSEDEMYRMAIQSNSASVTSVPMTLVSYAEFIWERNKEGKNLLSIGEMLGWTEAKTKQYSALSAIHENAWNAIVTTFESDPNLSLEEAVTKEVTSVTFTEGLLRNILNLTSDQQLELVQSLSHPDKDQRITKGKFTELAKAYQGRNEMKVYATTQLGNLGEEYTQQLEKEIDSGAYDAEWQKSKDEKGKVSPLPQPRPSLQWEEMFPLSGNIL